MILLVLVKKICFIVQKVLRLSVKIGQANKQLHFSKVNYKVLCIILGQRTEKKTALSLLVYRLNEM